MQVRAIRPLIGTVEHVRRELAWGMPIKQPTDTRSRRSTLRSQRAPPSTPRVTPKNKYTIALEQSARALGAAVLDATSCVERTIILAFHQADPPPEIFTWTIAANSPELYPTAKESRQKGWTFSQIRAIREVETQLKVARDEAREEMKRVFNDLDLQQRDADADPHIPEDALQCSLAMIALLQVSLSTLRGGHILNIAD